MFKRPPLKIECDGLSQKLIAELADMLSLHFIKVEIFDETIFASKPLGGTFHYGAAWKILDAFGVKAS